MSVPQMPASRPSTRIEPSDSAGSGTSPTDDTATTALRLPPVTRRLGLRISGLGIAYDPPPGSHRPVGTRAADVVGADGRRLYEALRSGRHVLVAPKGFPAPELDGRLHVLPLQAGTPRLVRPDGYVGWVGEGVEGLDDALRHWGVL